MASLLKLYGLPEQDPRFEALMTLARQRDIRGWWRMWDHATNAAYREYIALETTATDVLIFQPNLIPGLFQTADYARTIISSVDMAPADSVAPQVELRMARQSVLSQPNAPRITAIIGAAALQAVIPDGGMEAQARALVHAAARPNVDVRVLPARTPAHPGLTGGFSLLRFAEGPEFDVVYMEYATGSLYVEDPAEVSRYAQAHALLLSLALSAEASREYLTRIAEGSSEHH
ncbi:hypothetical protein FHU37_004224 [Allostreptomyces psammosilenae]|uniref:DUF5753 domain-containing protein n=1 Tax=Allostreptomyces psammosilenae TaxID=1892865 RepID=A0A853A9I6_9ACTN|nr:hypothetical protein [Allostreptomyces psammosilenae]